MPEKQSFNPNANYQDADKFSKSHEARYKEVDPMNQALMRMVEAANIKNKVVLDLGCGDGVHTKDFVEMGAKSVIGIDLSEELITKANTDHGADTQFIVGSVENLPLAENSVDFIHFRFALHYAHDIDKVMSEMYRVLKEGGEAFVVIPHPDDLYKRFKYQIKENNMVTQEIYPGFPVTYPYHLFQEYFSDTFFEKFSIENMEQIRLQDSTIDTSPDVLMFKFKKRKDKKEMSDMEKMEIVVNKLFYKTIFSDENRSMFSKIFTKYNVDIRKLWEEFKSYNLGLGGEIAGGNKFYGEVYTPIVLMIHGFAKESYHEMRELHAEELISLSGGSNIVEVGYGFPSPHIFKTLKNGKCSSYTLLDFDKNINTFSRDTILDFSDVEPRNVTAKDYNMDDMQYPGDYDTYVYLDSMEHTQNPTEYLKMLVSKMKSGSKLVMSIPVTDLENSPLKAFYFHEWKTILDSQEWLKSSGLSILEERVVITNPEVDMFAKFLPEGKLINHMVLCVKK